MSCSEHEHLSESSQNPSIAPNGYEPSLDGLRAVAVMTVAIYHVYGSPLPGGWAGVDMFFVLSGFLITRILLKEMSLNGGISLRLFYCKRFLRLAPAFACLLIFEVMSLPFLEDKTSRISSIIVSATYLMNWSRAFGWAPVSPLDHTWSLAVEEQFYIVWPLILIRLNKGRPILWLGLACFTILAWRIILVLNGSETERTYNGFDTHADSLFIGCALAYVERRFKLPRIHPIGIMCLIGVGMVLLFFFKFHSPWTQSIGLSLAAICSAGIIVASLQTGWLKTTLSLPPLVYTGRISYGIYLWHFPIFLLGHPYVPYRWGFGLVVVAYLVAALSFHFIEKPALALKARLSPI